jgi:hypothetical protein
MVGVPKSAVVEPETFLSRLKKDLKTPKMYMEALALLVLLAYTSATFTANSLMKTALSLGQRAYLSYSAVETIPSGVKIHLSNFGHVPAKLISGVSFRYLRATWPENAGLADIPRNLPESLTVMPGTASESAVLLDLPKLSPDDQAALDAGRQMLAIYGKLRYDTGFNSTDELLVAITYQRETKSWVHVNDGTRIDFTK